VVEDETMTIEFDTLNVDLLEFYVDYRRVLTVEVKAGQSSVSLPVPQRSQVSSLSIEGFASTSSGLMPVVSIGSRDVYRQSRANA
jgi:hypothetical protein